MTNVAALFKGRNFMTPTVLRFGRSDERGGGAAGRVRFYELSIGVGLYGETIYGVSVRDSNGNRFDPDPSKMFRTLTEAEAHIATL